MAVLNTIVHEARRWLGTPYRHQAATRGAGCDCLGLVRGVWHAVYGSEPQPIPPYGADWRGMDDENGLEDAALRHMRMRNGAPEPGDALLFRLIRHRPARHCGIMSGVDRFIHAQEHVGVVEIALGDAWRRRIAGVFVFPER